MTRTTESPPAVEQVVGEWKARAVNALKLSIEHWERLAAGGPNMSEPYAADCACCAEFYAEEDRYSCERCPVRLETGAAQCLSTPYRAARNSYEELGPESNEFKTAAIAEVEFLRTVLRLVELDVVKP